MNEEQKTHGTKSLIIFYIGIGIIIVIGIIPIYSQLNKVPEGALTYINDYSRLNPKLTTYNDINCSNLSEDSQAEVSVVKGRVGFNILQRDYCVIDEAIKKSIPDLCNKIKDERIKDFCLMTASWNKVELCDEYYSDSTEYKSLCIERAVMSAYNHGRYGKAVWSSCLNIITSSEYGDSLNCFVGAAYHEQDPSICESLLDKTRVKECKEAAKYLIKRG